MSSRIILILITVMLGVLISIIPYSWMATWSGLLFNAMHFPAFAILGGLIQVYLSRHSRVVGGLCILLPFVVECVQLWVGRSFDWVDLAWGYAGLFVGMYYRRMALLIPLAIGLVYVVWVVFLGYKAATPYLRLPLIASFESDRDFWFIDSIGRPNVSNLSTISTRNSKTHVLSVEQGNTDWTGLYIQYNWYLDLTPYEGLQLDIKQPNSNTTLDIKLDDGSSKKIYSLKLDQSDWRTYTVKFDHDNTGINWQGLHSISIYVPTISIKEPILFDNIRFY